jgi:hypothetical protein
MKADGCVELQLMGPGEGRHGPAELCHRITFYAPIFVHCCATSVYQLAGVVAVPYVRRFDF